MKNLISSKSDMSLMISSEIYYLNGRKFCGRNSCRRYFHGICFWDFAQKSQN